MTTTPIAGKALRLGGLLALMASSSAFAQSQTSVSAPTRIFNGQAVTSNPLHALLVGHSFAPKNFGAAAFLSEGWMTHFPGAALKNSSYLSVGQTDLIQASRFRLAACDKTTGAVLSDGTAQEWFGLDPSLNVNVIDVSYDRTWNRYFVNMIGVEHSSLLAISSGPNATGGWSVYHLDDSTRASGTISLAGQSRETLLLARFNVELATVEYAAIAKTKAVNNKPFKLTWVAASGYETNHYGSTPYTATSEKNRPIYSMQLQSLTTVRVFAFLRTDDGQLVQNYEDITIPQLFLNKYGSLNDIYIQSLSLSGDHLMMAQGNRRSEKGAGSSLGIRWYDIQLNNFGMPGGGSPVIYQCGDLFDSTIPSSLLGATGYVGAKIERTESGDIGLLLSRVAADGEAAQGYWASHKADEPLNTLSRPIQLGYDGFVSLTRDLFTSNALWGSFAWRTAADEAKSEIFRFTPSAEMVTAFGIRSEQPNVLGGFGMKGFVDLSRVAASGGAKVTLTSSNPLLVVPAFVNVKEGTMTKAFDINTSAVTKNTTVTLTASYGGVEKTTQVVVAPVLRVVDLELSKKTVAGTIPVTGTVTLNGPAPVGGAVVTLSDNSADASVPASVTVPAGDRTATFTVSSVPVKNGTNVTVSAAFGGATKTAAMSLRKPEIVSVTMSPTTVKGGSSKKVIVTVKLEAPMAQNSFIEIWHSDGTVAKAPNNYVVPAGQKVGSFEVQHFAVTATKTCKIHVSYIGPSVYLDLTVTP